MFEAFLNLSRFQKRLISVGVDSFALFFALYAAFSLRLDQQLWVPSKGHLVVCGLTVIVTVVVFVRLGLYRAVVRHLSDRAFITVITGVSISAIALILLGYWFEVLVPRSVPIIYGALAFIFVSGTRMTIRMLVHRPRHGNKQFVAIVGAGETGLQLAKALDQGTEYHPSAFISLSKANHRALINGIPVYEIGQVERAVKEHRIKRLLLALDTNSGVNRKQLLKQLEPLAIPVQTVPGMSELVAGQARINDIRDLEIEDLLGRDPIQPDNAQLAASLYGKSILVTGAGGSIGSELCRQIVTHRPSRLVLLDQSEYSLYAIERELQSLNRAEELGVEIKPVLGSVSRREFCESVLRSFDIETVYHAAAYKHVPLVEHNIIVGVQNNVFGTFHLAEAAIAAGVKRFVLISTDKAVRPTNVMGASKRMAELVLQGYAREQSSTIFSMVRFGNVLGSSGSVVPLFRDQIRDGGPVTVTHPDIIRYFMTIPEASQLVLQAASMGQGGEVFVLDMGEPVKIADLARKMIHLMGLVEKNEGRPDGDIEIVFAGLRPGEKLYEELLIGDAPQGTAHPRIMMAKEMSMSWEDVQKTLNQLTLASQKLDCQQVVEILQVAPTGFTPDKGLLDLLCRKGAPSLGGRTKDSGKVRHLSSS